MTTRQDAAGISVEINEDQICYKYDIVLSSGMTVERTYFSNGQYLDLTK